MRRTHFEFDRDELPLPEVIFETKPGPLADLVTVLRMPVSDVGEPLPLDARLILLEEGGDTVERQDITYELKVVYRLSPDWLRRAADPGNTTGVTVLKHYDYAYRATVTATDGSKTLTQAYLTPHVDYSNVTEYYGAVQRLTWLVMREGLAESTRAASETVESIIRASNNYGEVSTARTLNVIAMTVGGPVADRVISGFSRLHDVSSTGSDLVEELKSYRQPLSFTKIVDELVEQKVYHIVVSYKRVRFDKEESHRIDPRTVKSMSDEQWQEITRVATEVTRRAGRDKYRLWIDEIASAREPNADWTTIGFLPYAMFEVIRVMSVPSGCDTDVDSNVWIYNERLLSELGVGYATRLECGSILQVPGKNFEALGALRAMSATYLRGNTYRMNEYWRTRIGTFEEQCVVRAGGLFPAATLLSLKSERISEVPIFERDLVSASLLADCNECRYDQGPRELAVEEEVVVDRGSEMRWRGIYEIVPRAYSHRERFVSGKLLMSPGVNKLDRGVLTKETRNDVRRN